MRIYTKAGDLAFEEFTFPDGQPHFKLLTLDDGFKEATIEIAIKRTDDIFRAILAADVLQRRAYRVNLDIRWLMGARMDRPISNWEPHTLDKMLTLIAVGRFGRMRVLDLHNPRSTSMLENVLPHGPVRQTFETLGRPLVVIPDKGATDRVNALINGLPVDDTVQCRKMRNLIDGKLSAPEIESPHRVKGKQVLIIDDICDGGGTFIQLGKLLREAGAAEVHLFVTHGIFSKGFKVFDGIIDRIFCTDSYTNWGIVPFIPVSCIPVSMKEIA